MGKLKCTCPPDAWWHRDKCPIELWKIGAMLERAKRDKFDVWWVKEDMKKKAREVYEREEGIK